MNATNPVTVTIAIAVALIGSLALTPLMIALARRVGAVSHPDGKRKLHARPTPLWGGGAVYLALMVSVLACYLLVMDRFSVVSFPKALSSLPAALALSTGLLCLLGCYDDLHEMRARWKLLGQIAATLPILLAGCYVERIVMGGYVVDLGWIGYPVTMAWLILGINALNLVDGMDGLASTIGITVLLGVAAIGFSLGLQGETLLALTLVAALLGFLVYNLPPARIYLGDCGSMTLGLALAFLAMRVSLVPRTGTTANATVAIALLFLPLLDTALAVLRRRLQGSGLMTADRGHVHHRLQDRGFTTWQVLGLLGIFSLAAAGVACMAAVTGMQWLAWMILGTLIVVVINRQLIGHCEWGLVRQRVAQTAAGWVQRSADTPSPSGFQTVNPPHTPRITETAVEEDVVSAGHIPGPVNPGIEKAKTAA